VSAEGQVASLPIALLSLFDGELSPLPGNTRHIGGRRNNVLNKSACTPTVLTAGAPCV